MVSLLGSIVNHFSLLQVCWRSNCKHLLLLAYQSFGVVYGDLSTSPIYVYTSSFSGRLNLYQDEQTVFGMFSLIFWTFTIIPLLKYVIIVLGADDNGEGESFNFSAFDFFLFYLFISFLLSLLILLELFIGGTFALYSLLCRHAKLSLLPNQQSADEELSTYYRDGYISQSTIHSPLKRFLEKHKRLRTCLLLIVLFGACMVIGDGVLTPAISGIMAYIMM